MASTNWTEDTKDSFIDFMVSRNYNELPNFLLKKNQNTQQKRLFSDWMQTPGHFMGISTDTNKNMRNLKLLFDHFKTIRDSIVPALKARFEVSLKDNQIIESSHNFKNLEAQLISVNKNVAKLTNENAILNTKYTKVATDNKELRNDNKECFVENSHLKQLLELSKKRIDDLEQLNICFKNQLINTPCIM